jgi:hypothetical protein
MTFDPVPGQTMAQQNSRELRGSGNGWAPVHANPVFSPPEPWAFAGGSGVTCLNCACGATKQVGAQRQCVKCGASWEAQ